MKSHKWLSRRLISGALVGVMLAVMTSLGWGASPASATVPPPEIEWEKTFGGSNHDYATGELAEQTVDGGYILAGATMSYGAGAYDIYLVKTDASGIRNGRRPSAAAGMNMLIVFVRPRTVAILLPG